VRRFGRDITTRKRFNWRKYSLLNRFTPLCEEGMYIGVTGIFHDSRCIKHRLLSLFVKKDLEIFGRRDIYGDSFLTKLVQFSLNGL